MDMRDYDGAAEADLALAPQRTSVLAILALICALICILPGTGLLAVIFGISALVGISSSRGRVGGTGLAVSGLVLGLVFTCLWVAIGIGAYQMANAFGTMFTQPANQSLTALDAGDYKAARSLLSTTAGASISDEQFQKFRSAYQAEMGAFKGVPQGWEFFAAYGQLGPIMQGMQGRNDVVPVPASFDKGMAVLLLQVDQTGGQRTSKNPTTPVELVPAKNFIILTPTKKQIELAPSGITFPGFTAQGEAGAGGVDKGAPPPEPPPAPTDGGK